MFYSKQKPECDYKLKMWSQLCQSIKFYTWLTRVSSESNHNTYIFFLSGFSITHNKGRKCNSHYPFKSKKYSVGNNLLGLYSKLLSTGLLFALVNTLILTMIFMQTEVNLIHFRKKKTLQSQLGKCLALFNWEESMKWTLDGSANTVTITTYGNVQLLLLHRKLEMINHTFQNQE